MLNAAGLTADKIETKSTITLDKDGDGFTITKAHLTVKAKVPGTDQAGFEAIAKQAEQGCPVSKVLKATITMDATLEG